MDFDQLRTFVEVVRRGSFSRAGQALFRSQSAVSAQIHGLEEEYGTRLLDRSARAVQVTAAGQVIYDFAVNALKLRRDSLRAAEEVDSAVKGILRIGANETTFSHILATPLARFSKDHPLVRIKMYRDFSNEIIQRVEENAIDLGIVTLPVKSASLKVKPLLRDPIMFLVHRKSPLAELPQVHVQHMAGQPLILLSRGPIRHHLDKLLEPYADRLQVVMEVPSMVMVSELVAAGAGVSFITAAIGRNLASRSDLKVIRPADLTMSREMGVIFAKGRSLSHAAQEFIDTLERHFNKSSPRTRTDSAPPAND